MMAARKMFGYRGAGPLPTTRWTIVIVAGKDASEARKQALAELCAMYWTPVYGFIQAMGRRPEDARTPIRAVAVARLISYCFRKARMRMKMGKYCKRST